MAERGIVHTFYYSWTKYILCMSLKYQTVSFYMMNGVPVWVSMLVIVVVN